MVTCTVYIVLIIKVTACNQRLHSQYWLTGHKRKETKRWKDGGAGGINHTCMHGGWILITK